MFIHFDWPALPPKYNSRYSPGCSYILLYRYDKIILNSKNSSVHVQWMCTRRDQHTAGATSLLGLIV